MGLLTKKNWKIEKQQQSISTEMIKNPYMGFYHIKRFYIHRSYALNDTVFPENAEDESILLLEFELSHYKNGEIDESGLKNLDDILTFFGNRDKDLILRFSYDYEGRAYEKEPQEKEIVFDHVRSICKVVNEHAGKIFMLQGFFIGNWGEMHGSRFLTESIIIRLHEIMRQVLSDEIWIAVRRPSYLRLLSYETNDKRLCLFNDAILSSDTDMGTYGQSGFMEDSFTRQEELAFQNKTTHRIPNGGEVLSIQNSADTYLEEVKEVVSTLSKMHISYLNREYDMNVYQKWSYREYQERDEFRNMDLFSVISAKMGYRFFLKNIEILEEDTMILTIANRGFANALFAIDGVLYIDDTEVIFKIKRRSILCGNETPIKVELPNNIPKGKYDLELALFKEGTLTPIHFANVGYENADRIKLGKIIRK
ncbi:MAG: DUF4832 domain-containing protein [Lachnospiraceae bacterium]|nr:DUF4832 domain-containing protein [Lachnospiraceae bacterium]